MTEGDSIAPGGIVGILGGGQLGRMIAMAAARLGFKVHIYCPEEEAPARQVAYQWTVGEYEDIPRLEAFAEATDVVTYEFENIPAETAKLLAKKTLVRPHPAALEIAQDRELERKFLTKIGVPVSPYQSVSTRQELDRAIDAVSLPAVLKTRRGGYDGKGQAVIRKKEDADAAWEAVNGVPSILEKFVSFRKEISVIIARGQDGQYAAFDPSENIHRDHILHQSLVPCDEPESTLVAAHQHAIRIAEALDYVGIMAIEMFVLEDGALDPLMINEIAPRVHNSGHWTIDACHVSQFEQHIRAICGWPLGTSARHSDALMQNLIGDEVLEWRTLMAKPQFCLHLYGKNPPRPGRKMGHYTRLLPLGTSRSQIISA